MILHFWRLGGKDGGNLRPTAAVCFDSEVKEAEEVAMDWKTWLEILSAAGQRCLIIRDDSARAFLYVPGLNRPHANTVLDPSKLRGILRAGQDAITARAGPFQTWKWAKEKWHSRPVSSCPARGNFLGRYHSHHHLDVLVHHFLKRTSRRTANPNRTMKPAKSTGVFPGLQECWFT